VKIKIKFDKIPRLFYSELSLLPEAIPAEYRFAIGRLERNFAFLTAL